MCTFGLGACCRHDIGTLHLGGFAHVRNKKKTSGHFVEREGNKKKRRVRAPSCFSTNHSINTRAPRSRPATHSLSQTMDQNLTIIEFCDRNNILWQPVDLIIRQGPQGAITKEYVSGQDAKPNDFDWLIPAEIERRQRANSAFQHIAIDTRTYWHVDIDWKDGAEAGAKHQPHEPTLERLALGSPHYKSVTKKQHGKHIFFQPHDDLRVVQGSRKRFSSYQDASNPFAIPDVEILSGSWAWAHKDTRVFNCEQGIQVWGEEQFHSAFGSDGTNAANKRKLLAKAEPRKKRLCLEPEPTAPIVAGGAPNEPDSSNPDGNEGVERYCNLIASEYIDDYGSWTAIVWALRADSIENYGIARRLSERSAKFDGAQFDALWGRARANGGYTIGTVSYYAQRSDPEAYQALRSESKVPCTDTELADEFLKLAERFLVFQNEQVYTCLHGKWFLDPNLNRLKQMINEGLGQLLGGILAVGSQDNKACSKVIERVGSAVGLKNIAARVVQTLSVRDYSHVEFDGNGLLFAFSDGVYNFESHAFTPYGDATVGFYTTTTLPYPYYKGLDELGLEVNAIKCLFEQVLRDEAPRSDYIRLLCTALVGVPIEKFIIANGDGGNGKGVIHELMEAMLGGSEGYYYTAPNSVLLAPMSGKGSCVEVASMSKKRMIVYREPDGVSAKLNTSTICELTGGSEINARLNHSNENSTKLCATHFMECNKKPPFQGRLDNAIFRRLLDFLFGSTFTTDKALYEDPERELYFKADGKYKLKTWQLQHRRAMFEFLRRKMIEFESNTGAKVWEPFEVCPAVKARTHAYLEDVDPILTCLKEAFELIPGNGKCSYVFAKDMHQHLKDSDLWGQFSKNEQRDWNFKAFVTHLRTSVNTRAYFQERVKVPDLATKKMPNQKPQRKDKYNVVLSWRSKGDEEHEAQREQSAKVLQKFARGMFARIYARGLRSYA